MIPPSPNNRTPFQTAAVGGQNLRNQVESMPRTSYPSPTVKSTNKRSFTNVGGGSGESVFFHSDGRKLPFIWRNGLIETSI